MPVVGLRIGKPKRKIDLDPIQERMTPGDFERKQQDKLISDRMARVKRKILVMSGKGGVGKSTVAAYMALLLSKKDKKVGLMDVDLHGPSIARLMKVRGGFDTREEGIVRPYAFSGRLSVVSLDMMLGEKDMAVIWRGPMKISAIRQFISDITWGDLDFLLVDAPPGTGDEPLTVAQTLPDAEALIVTTPQEISLADVRKSVNFCRQLELEILGVVENMSGQVCPHCGQQVPLFGRGGGEKMAGEMDIPFLGRIPVDHNMVTAGDMGNLEGLMDLQELEINAAYGKILDRVLAG
jgi:ATP-binding protein involved in chromosome partitioning